jgi:hypothetical protein
MAYDSGPLTQSGSAFENDRCIFLRGVTGIIQRRGAQPQLKVFISYAWEDGVQPDPLQVSQLRALQNRLGKLHDDLTLLGVDVFFDNKKFAGPVVATLEKALEQSDVILVICTERYADRAQKQEGGVWVEYRKILEFLPVPAQQKKLFLYAFMRVLVVVCLLN